MTFLHQQPKAVGVGDGEGGVENKGQRSRAQLWLRSDIFAHLGLVTGKFVPDAHSCFTSANETSGLLRKYKDSLSICALRSNDM